MAAVIAVVAAVTLTAAPAVEVEPGLVLTSPTPSSALVHLPLIEIEALATAEAERIAAELAAQAEAAALAEAAAAAERSRQAPPSQASPPRMTAPLERTSTGAPHSDGWWWGVAICEQGGRNDPYYGYFSWMDGSSAGKSWDEQVAMSNALLLRAGREIGPWAASCVAAGYRAAPDG